MMKKIQGVLDLKKTIRLLRKISRSKQYQVSSPDFEKELKISLKKTNKGFHFLLPHDEMLYKHDQWVFSNVRIWDKQFAFNTNGLYVSQKEFGLTSGKIGRVFSNDFSYKATFYYRMVIPVEVKPNFMFSIENVVLEYEYDQRIKTRNAIEVVIEEQQYHIYHVVKTLNKKKDNYLVIECDIPQNFYDFSEKCYSILIAFGYVSGSFEQNESFFFQYDEKAKIYPIGFNYSPLRNSIKCSYVPTNSNPHSFIHDREIAEQYRDAPRTLSSQEFSSLCNTIDTNDDFKSVILLIIESNTQSLVSSPGMLSIALESLANIIYNDNESALAPISDKTVAKDIRKRLKQEVTSFIGKIDEETSNILKSRIDQINQKTNREKLLIPFKILRLEINQKDVEAIEQRNAFLHGKSPMIEDTRPENIQTADRFRFYLYLKLYTLTAAVILKYCGFDNLILNYPKIYEAETGVKLEEGHYRNLKKFKR